MSKTKTIRANHADAFVIEQAVRELAAELQQEVRLSELIRELIDYVPQAKERLKNKLIATSKS